jgi:hypothetical protein
MRTPVLRLVAAAITVLFGATADASNVRYMNLRDLVAHADRIVRGTVLASDEGTVTAGGGAIPIVTYRIRVEESLKGGASAGETIEVRLLGRIKQPARGGVRPGPYFTDLPQFRIGGDYLFVLTRPSAIGLSTTVGLRQGLFELRGRRGSEQAVNGANNVGLLSGTSAASRAAAAPTAVGAGPIAYGELVKQIQSLVGR